MPSWKRRWNSTTNKPKRGRYLGTDDDLVVKLVKVLELGNEMRVAQAACKDPKDVHTLPYRLQRAKDLETGFDLSLMSLEEYGVFLKGWSPKELEDIINGSDKK